MVTATGNPPEVFDSALAASYAVQFWTSLGEGDREAAQRAGDQLNLPLVTRPGAAQDSPGAFSFQDVAAEVETAVPVQGAAGAASSGEGEQFATPRSVEPSTPQGTLDCWNHTVKVGVEFVTRSERAAGQLFTPGVCGAIVGSGVEDYLACGVIDCNVGTHISKKKIVPLPIDELVIVIKVRVSSQSVKPKFFSRPFVLWNSLPTDCQTDEVKELLSSLEFVARTWKFLFESYKGAEWMLNAMHGEESEEVRDVVDPLLGTPIPSPRAGRGGLESDVFEDYPPSPSPSDPPLYPGEDDSINVESVTGRAQPSRAPPPSTNRFWNPPAVRHRMFSGASGDDSYSLQSETVTEGGRAWQMTQARLAKLVDRDRKKDKLIRELQEAFRRQGEELELAFKVMREELDAARGEAEQAKSMADRALAKSNSRPPPPVSIQVPSPPANVVPPAPAESPTPWSDPVLFEHFVRQIAAQLNLERFTTMDDLKAQLTSLGIDTETGATDSINGILRRVANCELELFKPEGALAVIRAQLKLLDERRNANVVERGNQLFKDQHAVKAWVQLLEETNVYRYCVDMVVLLILTQDPFENIAEGMATEAAAYKAQYNDLLDARISLSHSLTYPDNMFARSSTAAAVLTDGWSWTVGWSTHDAFEGTFNNGAHFSIKQALEEVTKMIQNAINFAYPTNVAPIPNAIFSEQLRTSYDQAIGFVDSFDPLFKTLSKGGLTPKEAWSRVFVYSKSVFEDIGTVRKVSAVRDASAMIWGSFRTAELLKEYTRLRWLQHPQVSATLALTSMQREGKAIHDAAAARGGESAVIKKHTDEIKLIKLVLERNNLQ